ncbi:MAG: hypothetical protein IJ991_16085 [Thermoguttaceae bacterium]|nr:hypothetical protein [Thermoguttaceae bacterium]
MTLTRSPLATRPRTRERRSLGASLFSTLAVATLLLALPFAIGRGNESDVRDASSAAVSVSSELEPDSSASASARSNSDVPFRFWMAPADKIDRWPWGDEKYYPVRPETFDAWLRATSEPNAPRSDAPTPSVVSALFLDAKFETDALEGTGTFALSFVGDASSSADAALLPPFAAAVSSFAKLVDAPRSADADASSLALNAPDAPSKSDKAFVGLYPDSRLYLSDPQNGFYSFRWSRRGSVDSTGAVSFDLVLPPSPRTELRLTAPVDAVVSVSNGFVEPVESPASVDATVPESSADAAPSNASDASDAFLVADEAPVSRLPESSENAATTRTWRVFLGGETQTRLTIARTTPLDARRQIGYRQETSRRLSLEGVEVVSRFSFDRSPSTLDDATLVFDATLVPVSVDWNGEKIDVATLPRTTDGETTRLRLRAPKRRDRDQETLGELDVVAFCPLERKNASWRLPSVRLESDALFWKETLCRLTVVRPLFLASATPIDAAQTSEPRRARQDDQDVFAFKFFSPTAGVAVDLRTRQTTPTFDSATDCLVSNDEISAKTTLFVQCDRQDATRFALPLTPGWEIDAVQTSGDERIAWTREERDGRARLVLSFPTAPATDRPTRVSLAARFSEPVEQTIAVDRLAPLDLANELNGAHALALRSESSTQIELTTRAGRPFVPVKTTPKFVFNETLLRDALGGAAVGTRLYLGDQTADAVATLRRQRLNYAAELSGVGELDATKFATVWRLRCVPATGSRIDRVLFFVSRENERTVAETAPWTWAFATEPDRVFPAAPLDDVEAAALDLPPGVAAFEIRLATSRSVPFELRLFKNSPTTETIEAPLVFLPEAAVESADFVVAAPTGLAFRTRAQGLEATLAPPAPNDEFEPIQEAFRYAPVPTPDGETPRLALDLLSASVDAGASADAPEEDAALVWRWFEKYDAFYETNGTIRNRAVLYLENRGRPSLLLRAPVGFDPATTNAVWVDAQRVPWTLETLDDGAAAIRVDLPPRRRFVCVELEYVVDGKPLVGRARLTPTPFECDVPALGGAWNVWIPPEFQTCERAAFFGDERDATSSAFLALLPFGDARDVRVAKVAKRFLRRFGDETALRQALANAASESTLDGAPSSAPATASSAPSSGNAASPTWGAVFGAPSLVAQLFAPDAPDAAPASPSDANASPFGALDATRAPFRLYVDRFALARRRLTPTTPLVFAPAPESDAVGRADKASRSQKIALQTLDDAGVVLLFVDETLAVLTSNDVLANFAPQDLETPDDATAVRRVKTAAAGRRFRDSLLAETSPRFVVASAWPQTDDAPPVWQTRFGEENASGWIRATKSLDRAKTDGVWIVERYWLAALEWFCLVGVVVATWRRRFATPSFFVALLGLSVAVRCAAPLEIALAARGVAIGTLCAAGFYTVRFLAPHADVRRRDFPESAPRDADFSRRSRVAAFATESASAFPAAPVDDLDVVVRDAEPPFAPAAPRERRRETPGSAPAPDESTQGFVDLSKLPFATRRRLEGPSDAPLAPPPRRAPLDGEVGVVDDASTESRPDSAPLPPSFPRRQGTISTPTTTALATLSLALLLGASTFAPVAPNAVPSGASVFADDAPVATAPTTAPSLETPAPTGPVASPDAESTPGPADATNAPSTWREPRRVFVPVDDERRPVGPYYWIPADFYEEIRSTLAERPTERSWRVVDALYEGVVNHNAFADATSLFNLTATYSIVLDEPNATIALPATRLAPDFDVKFDDRAIAPTFAENGREIFFEIVDATPGEHVLELTIAPPQFSETNAEISFPIPRVPSSRLELAVPPDAPTLDFPNALGKTTRSSGRVVVELGAVDRLVVAKAEPNAKSDKATVDVEQLFLMRARPTQADVRASFRCQVVGGKIDSLVLVGDPLYSFSGYCQCDKAEVDSVEPLAGADGSLRVSFKTPISGSFALDADFVASRFSGVGRARLPSISVRDARVLKNWLALSPGDGVECADPPPATETVAAFQTAWGTPLKETPFAVYDLAKTPRGAAISTRLKSVRPVASETTTLVFRPTQIETRLVATIDAPTEVFRLDLETPTPFVVDEIALFDDQNVALETPDYFLDPGALVLLFRSPLKGRRVLQIVGRAQTTLDVARPFPVVSLQNVNFKENVLRLYRATNAYLDWTTPNAWSPLDASRLAAETLAPAPGDDVHLVGAFDATAPRATVDGAVGVDAESTGSPVPARPDDVVVRLNAPRLEGVQRVFLYRKDGAWKTAVDFRVDVQNGRVDRFCVALDESYSLEPLDPASDFVATESTLETGERVVVFQPKKTPLVGPAEFVFVATMKNERENVRLPRFRLLPSSPREDVSGVRRFAFLPRRVDATPIRWETEKLRAVDRDDFPQTTLDGAPRGAAALVAGIAPNAAPAFVVPPSILTNESGMSNVDSVDFSIGETLGVDADAWIASENDRLQISRARASFYVDARREIFVSTTFSLRPNAPRECVLLVPETARVLEATVNGSRRRVDNLGGGRWAIDLDATRFGKRLEVAVQIPSNAGVSSSDARSTTCELVVPRVEGAAPDETTWFCAFESFDDAAPRWRVRQRDVADPDAADSNAPERPETLLEPVRYSDANALLFRLCADDANALLAELESDAALFANARADEFERRRVRWARAWRRNEREIARFVAPERGVEALDDARRAALLVVRADAASDATPSPLETWSNSRYRELLERKSNLESARRFADVLDDAPNVAPEILWAVDQTLDARVLAGWTDANLDRLVVVAPPRRFELVASRFGSALFVLATTAIALRLLRPSLKSRRLQRLSFVFLVGVAALAFFVFRRPTLGLTFVALLAVVPPLVETTRRRAERRRPTPSDAPPATLDGETTASLAAERRDENADETTVERARAADVDDERE